MDDRVGLNLLAGRQLMWEIETASGATAAQMHHDDSRDEERWPQAVSDRE